MTSKIIAMKKTGNGVLLMMGLLILGVQADAQKINSFSVLQTVDYAKQNSVQVKNAMLDILIQQQTNRDITSIALPQINGSGSVTDYLVVPTTLVPAQFFGGNPGEFAPVKFGTKWSAGANLAVSQLIFADVQYLHSAIQFAFCLIPVDNRSYKYLPLSFPLLFQVLLSAGQLFHSLLSVQ